MTSPGTIVFIIDDDASVRRGLVRLLESADHRSEVFPSATAFLERPAHDGCSCVIVDVRMPGLTGIDLQEALLQRRRDEELIFITGHGDIAMCARVMKSGAVDFLAKPFQPEQLLGCVRQGPPAFGGAVAGPAGSEAFVRSRRFINATGKRSDAARHYRALK